MIKRYKVYTLPKCDKCKDVKSFLAATDLEGNFVDLSNQEDLQDFRKIYPTIKEKLPRMRSGSLPVPIVILYDEKDNISVAEDIEAIKRLI